MGLSREFLWRGPLFQSETLLTELPHNVEAIYRLSKKGSKPDDAIPLCLFSLITFNRLKAIHSFQLAF